MPAWRATAVIGEAGNAQVLLAFYVLKQSMTLIFIFQC